MKSLLHKIVSVMNRSRNLVILLKSLLLGSGLTGWPLSAAPAAEPLARVHWLGLDRISTNADAARFVSVWRLPQTDALEADTLDKLSRWPGHGATNAASGLLRPLLDDFISSEFYLELSAATNPMARRSDLPRRSGTETGAKTALARRSATETAQLSCALRLPAARARLWQTNLAAALENLTGARPVPAGNGWVFRQTNAPVRIEFARSGDWTLVRLGPDTKNSLSEFGARVARDAASSAATNCWLELDLNLSRLVSLGFGRDALPRVLADRQVGPTGSMVTVEGQTPFDVGEVGSKSVPMLSHLHLTFTAESGNVITRGTLDLSRPLASSLPAWEIPTNLIHQPLTSFIAVRGFASWLAALPAWQKLEFTPPPDQAYFWAPSGAPFQTYFAAPLPAASNQLRQLAGHLVQYANPWMTTNGTGFFQWQTNPPALVWIDALILSPYLKPDTANQQDYVLGNLARFVEANTNPPPAELLSAVLGTRNLVYYHFEQTDRRIDDDLFVSQLFRVLFHKPQLPPTANLWLKNLELLMGDSTTVVTQTDADQLSFTRTSTIGVTAFELHLLADWLESPQFPRGLHTFTAP